MPPALTCPPENSLEKLLLGKLPEGEAATVEEHLLTCGACLDTTRRLKESGDELLRALQADSQVTSAIDSEAMRKLAREIQERSLLGTVGTSPDETGTPVNPGQVTLSAFSPLWTPSQQADELGRLGDFRILKLLGHGGMGAVFLAQDVNLKRDVALKLMHPTFAAHPESAARFLREAQAAAAVRNDHVVAIYQVGRANGVPFIAQERLEGESLYDRLKREPRLTLEESLRIAREIALGLGAAHAKGLLHRDIKPSNVWLESSGRVKILDFGLARPVAGEEQLTHTGMILGTPAYMAPEQAKGQPVTGQADLFSLGTVLYELVTGRLPFHGTDKVSMLLEVVASAQQPAHQVNSAVPTGISQFIQCLLEKSPDKRPASAREVAEELQRLRDVELQDRVAARAKPQPNGWSRASRWRFQRLALLGAAALALIILGATIYRVQTAEGTLVIEVEDEAVEAKLKKVGLVIVDTKNNRQYTLRAAGNQLAKPGAYVPQAGQGLKLTVIDDQGLEVTTEEFKLAQGKKLRVRVTLESNAAVATKPLPVPNSVPRPNPSPSPSSPLAAINAAAIPAAERFPWQSPELVAVLGEHRQRLWWTVGSVTFSPDGKIVFAATTNGGNLSAFDANSGASLALTNAKAESAWSPDGVHVISRDGKHQFIQKLRHFPDGQITLSAPSQIPNHTNGHLTSFSFAPHLELLATVINDRTLSVYDMSKDEPEVRFELAGHQSPVFSPDGKRMAALRVEDKRVRLFTVEDNAIRPAFDLAGDDGLAAVGSDGGSGRMLPTLVFLDDSHLGGVFADRQGFRIWNLSGDSPETTQTIAGPTIRMTYAPQAKRLVITGHAEFLVGRIFDWRGGKLELVTSFNVDTGLAASNLHAVAISPDGTRVASGHLNGAVAIWDVTPKGLQQVKPLLPQPRGKFLFSADGKTLLTYNERNQWLPWSLGQKQPVLDEAKIPKNLGEAKGALWINPREYILSKGQLLDGRFTIVEAATGQQRFVRKSEIQQAPAAQPVVTDHAVALPICDNDRQWSVLGIAEQEGKVMQLFEQSFGPMVSTHDDVKARLSRNGQVLITGVRQKSGGYSNTIWKVANGTLTKQIEAPSGNEVCFDVSDDGSTIVMDSELWAVEQGNPMKKHRFPTSSVCALSRDGKRVALSAGGVYRTDNGELIWDCKLPGNVTDLEFAPDGIHLVAANNNGTVYIYRLPQ